MFTNSRRFYYYIERTLHYLNNTTILATLILAFFWIKWGKSEFEAWIALLGIASMILSKSPNLLEYVGYEKSPLGKGVITKGGCWIDEGQEEHKMKLGVDINKFKTKIDYIPTERVMAHIIDGYLIFKRREGDSGHKLRVDYELIKKD